MQEISSSRCFDGEQKVFAHTSAVLGCTMRLGIYLPPGGGADRPVLTFLSGLTCTEQNTITKAGAQRYCAEHGLIFATPDTSPRGEDVPDDADWALGQGAGFYLTATQAPWSRHYRMDRYVTEELPALLRSFTTSERRGIMGHSMGGHGAIVLALRHPGLYQSVSALAPILEPATVPWGRRAFTAYLGDDASTWRAWDARFLIADAAERLPLLIDQGTADGFLDAQLHSSAFRAACAAAGHPLVYRQQAGYDHSFYFVASFMGEHVAHHAAALG